MRLKVYIIQRADPVTGEPLGEPLGAKLTFEAAHAIAKQEAPARVTGPLWADKRPAL